MNTQTSMFDSLFRRDVVGEQDSPRDVVRSVGPGRVLALGSAGGRLEVLQGRIWLTRAGDRDDHFVDFGQSVVVPASGRVLVQALDDGERALIAWHPARLFERAAAAVDAVFARGWDIVDPPRRIGAGALAAALALAAGALVFGPLSEARTRELVASGLLHNSAGPTAGQRADRRPTSKESRADAAADPRERARSAAQEACRRAPGVA